MTRSPGQPVRTIRVRPDLSVGCGLMGNRDDGRRSGVRWRPGGAPASTAFPAAGRAGARLRDRLSARIGGTIQEPMARTPHSYAFGVLRRSRVLEGDPPPRLISAPEQDRVLAELLAGHAEGLGTVPRWPGALTDQIRQLRGFREELADVLMRAVERGLTPADLARLSRERQRPEWFAAAQVMAEYL